MAFYYLFFILSSSWRRAFEMSVFTLVLGMAAVAAISSSDIPSPRILSSRCCVAGNMPISRSIAPRSLSAVREESAEESATTFSPSIVLVGSAGCRDMSMQTFRTTVAARASILLYVSSLSPMRHSLSNVSCTASSASASVSPKPLAVRSATAFSRGRIHDAMCSNSVSSIIVV